VLVCKASAKLSLALVQVAIAISAAKLRANLLLPIVKKHVFTTTSFNFLFKHLLQENRKPVLFNNAAFLNLLYCIIATTA
jgi:hypothetical protein